MTGFGETYRRIAADLEVQGVTANGAVALELRRRLPDLARERRWLLPTDLVGPIPPSRIVLGVELWNTLCVLFLDGFRGPAPDGLPVFLLDIDAPDHRSVGLLSDADLRTVRPYLLTIRDGVVTERISAHAAVFGKRVYPWVWACA